MGPSGAQNVFFYDSMAKTIDFGGGRRTVRESVGKSAGKSVERWGLGKTINRARMYVPA